MSQEAKRGIGPRRSKLVVKGGTFEGIAAANSSGADIVHIELEGGFPPEKRPDAVRATCRALRELDWSMQEAWVRFRHIDAPGTAEEIEEVMAERPSLVYCAKVRSEEDIVRLHNHVSRIESQLGLPVGETALGAVIERVAALSRVEQIASASPRMSAIMFGANDMSLDFGYRRTGTVGSDEETIYIRSRMIMAGRLAGIDIVDAAFAHQEDLEGGEADARFSARMGFTAKNTLDARQVPGIHRAFEPTQKELKWAEEVLSARKTGGLLDDEPVRMSDVVRAQRTLARMER
jgi:citrate lyase subunit beta/citryl-CoA lyase